MTVDVEAAAERSKWPFHDLTTTDPATRLKAMIKTVGNSNSNSNRNPNGDRGHGLV